eukprot:GEMP01107762.1.p1 GENE.GEMP01107762.1~~GEMP01107762.1.p1  ORF type:complete len:133 (+),score=23.42 GEMP01107762.1:125-523(+)
MVLDVVLDVVLDSHLATSFFDLSNESNSCPSCACENTGLAESADAGVSLICPNVPHHFDASSSSGRSAWDYVFLYNIFATGLVLGGGCCLAMRTRKAKPHPGRTEQEATSADASSSSLSSSSSGSQSDEESA